MSPVLFFNGGLGFTLTGGVQCSVGPNRNPNNNPNINPATLTPIIPWP